MKIVIRFVVLALLVSPLLAAQSSCAAPTQPKGLLCEENPDAAPSETCK